MYSLAWPREKDTTQSNPAGINEKLKLPKWGGKARETDRQTDKQKRVEVGNTSQCYLNAPLPHL